MEKYILVLWPEVQQYMDVVGFDDNSRINVDFRPGEDNFYFIKEKWLQTIQ